MSWKINMKYSSLISKTHLKIKRLWDKSDRIVKNGENPQSPGIAIEARESFWKSYGHNRNNEKVVVSRWRFPKGRGYLSFFRGVQLLKWLYFTHFCPFLAVDVRHKWLCTICILVYLMVKPPESIYEMLRIDFLASDKSILSTNSLLWNVFAAFAPSLITLGPLARLSARTF